MKQEGKAIYLTELISGHPLSLRQVLMALPDEVTTVYLGFTPLLEDAAQCRTEPYDGEEDYRLFVKGGLAETLRSRKLYFPELSHA